MIGMQVACANVAHRPSEWKKPKKKKQQIRANSVQEYYLLMRSHPFDTRRHMPTKKGKESIALSSDTIYRIAVPKRDTASIHVANTKNLEGAYTSINV